MATTSQEKKAIIKIKRVREGVLLPTRGSELAAGWDLRACLDKDHIKIPKHKTVLIPVGISTELPIGMAALILARSGLSLKKSLAPINEPGLIDCDYRGEWHVALHNFGRKKQYISNGERIAQAVFIDAICPLFSETSKLSTTDRGTGGHGSTGQF